MPSFPAPALPGILGTITASDSRTAVWFPPFVALYAILPLRGEQRGSPRYPDDINVKLAMLSDPGRVSLSSHSDSSILSAT